MISRALSLRRKGRRGFLQDVPGSGGRLRIREVTHDLDEVGAKLAVKIECCGRETKRRLFLEAEVIPVAERRPVRRFTAQHFVDALARSQLGATKQRSRCEGEQSPAGEHPTIIGYILYIITTCTRNRSGGSEEMGSGIMCAQV